MMRQLAMNRIRVLLVDDHAVVRAGYRVLLRGDPELEIVAEAESGERAYQLFLKHAPDVVIMDLSLPGMGGLEAIKRIIARDDSARILVFSMHEDTAFVEQALQAGAKGYITKSSAPEVLLDAVREIAAGEVYLDRRLAQDLAMMKGGSGRFSALSPREFSIFCLLAEGLGNAAIADRLSLSAKTVANYSTIIKKKLGIENRAGLVYLALRHGIVQPEPSAPSD